MEDRGLVGARVIVQNPSVADAVWAGECVAYSDQPSILVETAAGRVMLPAAWATITPS